MQVTETSADGLKREFKVVIPAQQFHERIESRLRDRQRSMRLPGFRQATPARQARQAHQL